MNVKINNNKTSVNDIKNYSPEKKRNSFAQNNNNNQNSLKNILSPPRTLALNLNNKNDYELKNFHENDAKQIKTPTTPSYHYQAHTPTSTNSLKKIMKTLIKLPPMKVKNFGGFIYRYRTSTFEIFSI